MWRELGGGEGVELGLVCLKKSNKLKKKTINFQEIISLSDSFLQQESSNFTFINITFLGGTTGQMISTCYKVYHTYD